MEESRKETGVAEAAPSLDTEEVADMRVKLEQPFMWDGAEVTEIDLNGLFDMTARDLCDVDREAARRGFGGGTRVEVSRVYAMLLSAKLNKKPYDWLDNMKGRDSVRLRETIATFFFLRA